MKRTMTLFSLALLVLSIGLAHGNTGGNGTRPLVPYTEDFDGVSAPNLPAGWSVIDNDEDNLTWTTHPVNPISAPNSLWSVPSYYDPKDDYVVSPGLELTGGNTYYVSFSYRSGNRGTERFRVLLGTAACVDSLTTMVFNEPGFNNTQVQNALATFTVSSTDTYYLAWHCYSDPEQYILQVDDIEVGEGTPNPPNLPYLLYPANGMDYANVNGFDLRWSQTYPSGDPTHWKVYMSQDLDSLFTDHSWVTYFAWFDPVEDGGLAFQYEQTWYWTVEAFNADGSALAPPRWFQIHADPTVSVFPYEENFDGVEAPDLPPGWTVHNANHDNQSWSTGGGGNTSWPNTMQIFRNETLAMNDWAISPPLVLEGGTSYALDFWYSVSSGTPERLKLTYGDSSWYGLHTEVLLDLVDFSNYNPLQAQVVFTPAVSGTYYLGWHGYSPANGSVLRIDDISLEVLEPGIPGMPVLQSPLPGTTGLPVDGFELSWSPDPDGGAPASYKVYLSPSENGLLTGDFWTTANTSFNPVTEGGLSLDYSQTWYWTVEAVNSDGCVIADPPFWFETQDPTTVVEFPWQEDFEDAAFPPQNWTSVKVYPASPSEWLRSTQQNHSPGGTASARHGRNAVHSSEGWLITPAINLPASDPMMLSFWQYSTYTQYYEYVGVYASTGSPDPLDGDYEEIWSPGYVEQLWMQTPVSLQDYAGQTIHLGFKYLGANANEWYLDDIRVSSYDDYLTGPEISHRRHLNTFQSGEPYPIQARITDPDGIAAAELYYQVNYGDYITLPLAPQGEGVYQALIPPQPLGTHISYYLGAADATAYGTFTETDGYGFDVSEPVWLSYQEGDLDAVVGHASQSWEARIVYPNPAGAGAPMKLNSVKTRLLYPGSAMLQVFSWEDGTMTPLMAPLEVNFPQALTDEVFDLSALNLTLSSSHFLISLTEIPAYNYIPVVGPSPYADMNYFVLDGSAASFVELGLDRVYQIEANVQSGDFVLAAPELIIAYGTFGIGLSWDPVPGATGYKIYAADTPDDDAVWTLIASTDQTGYACPGGEARRFFRVLSFNEP